MLVAVPACAGVVLLVLLPVLQSHQPGVDQVTQWAAVLFVVVAAGARHGATRPLLLRALLGPTACQLR